MSDGPHTLAAYLEALRVERSLSQNTFADAAGVSKKTMSRLINGLRADPDTLVTISEHLHIDPLTLFALAYLPNQKPSKRSMIIREMTLLLEEMPEDAFNEAIKRIRFEFNLALERIQNKSKR